MTLVSTKSKGGRRMVAILYYMACVAFFSAAITWDYASRKFKEEEDDEDGRS